MQEKSNSVNTPKSCSPREAGKFPWRHSSEIKAIFAELGYTFTMDTATGQKLHINGKPYSDRFVAAEFNCAMYDNGIRSKTARDVAVCIAHEKWQKALDEAMKAWLEEKAKAQGVK